MAAMTFHFRDSEVGRIHQDGPVLSVVFSAANVAHRAQAAMGRTEGFALGLEMRLTGVLGAAPLDGCIGRLSGGSLSAGGESRSSIALPELPFEWAGTTQVTLSFGLGPVWSAQALKVAFLWAGEPRFVESLAC